jgi:hypothetical protein
MDALVSKAENSPLHYHIAGTRWRFDNLGAR